MALLKQKEHERMSLLQFAGLVIAVTFILYAAWRIGFEDGRTFTKLEGAMTISRIIESAQSGDSELLDSIADIPEGNYGSRVLTYADLAALEEAQKQKEEKEKGADK